MGLELKYVTTVIPSCMVLVLSVLRQIYISFILLLNYNELALASGAIKSSNWF